MSPLLELRDLRVKLGAREAVRGVTLALARGAFVGLIGPNGAGKSTLMRAALGLIPAQGDRLLGGDPVARLAPPERARRAAWAPQEREIAWPLPVRALVALGRAPHRAGPATARDARAVDAAMARMDVAQFADRPADQLSGGERARALIARALAQEAPLLLADEPTAGLDPAHQIALMEAFAALAAEGRGVMASLHDLGLAARWCHRLILLDAGRVAAEGPPREVLTPELLARIYGVRAHLDWGPEGPVVQPTGLARA
ncbi:MAG: ABC transporter ATP-binding protein [Rubrimonas sp.]|uniref:ABC transporter ATP-binding protein n=1 Tax=Rubrimonas sp. TaxID=2036015 RepID=UPI003DD2D9E9